MLKIFQIELSTLLGFIGILASAIFGIWGIYYSIKQRYPGKITFIKEHSIALFDAIVKNLPELSILYKQNPVTPNLVLIQGALVNTGKKDISPTMVEKPISISLPEGYKWITAKVISFSENVIAEIHLLDETNLVLNNGLFRCKEYIRFQALVEVPGNEEDRKEIQSIKEKIGDYLIFSHRISDTRQINKIELKEEESISKRLKRFIMLTIFGSVAALTLVTFVLIKGLPGEFVYSIKNEKNELINVTATPLQNHTIKVEGIDKPYSIIMPEESFFSQCVGNPKIIDKPQFYLILSAILSYILAPLCILIFYYWKYRANKKLRRMIMLE